jgi:integrase
MISAIIAENFICAKKNEYVGFVDHLGTGVCFLDDKWVCDRLRRAPSEKASDFTLYFSKIPEQHREMVKYFSIINLICGKSITTVRTYISDLIRFFCFWSIQKRTSDLYLCDEFTATEFYRYLEERGLTESTNIGVWSSVSTFFKTMNGWDGQILKNPFSISPYCRQRRFDDKYIPESVALQLDTIFKRDEIALHLQCAYWLLRLIPSRIGEIVGMRIDCLKRFDGDYVLFIPTWKQNGGWRAPIMRSIHLEKTGIAGYLIDLVQRQQEAALQLQDYMPDSKKGALFTYRQRYDYKRKTPYYTKLCFVATGPTIRTMLQTICEKYGVTDDDGKIYKVTTHQFRHNGITDRLAAGFTAAQIAEMTGHHGDAMIYNAYAHLDLLPKTIIKKQEFVSKETASRENRYILFGGRILNMEAQLEKRLLRNLRAHKVRGGICSDITGCKSDMWNCLECGSFVPDAEQAAYYEEQAALWREKCERFSKFPIIKGNAEKNAELFECILKKLKEDGCLS